MLYRPIHTWTNAKDLINDNRANLSVPTADEGKKEEEEETKEKDRDEDE